MSVSAPDERGRALAAAAAACAMWGVLPLFLKLLAHLPALDVTAHRIVWTAASAAAAAAVFGGLAQLRVDAKALARLMLASVLIGLNWWLYVWAVANDRLVEASIGYFILPLISVAFGVMFFGERLSRTQWAAIALALAGVLNITIAAGVAPWVALGVALSFGLYGIVKKTISVSAPTGLFWETAMLAAPAAILLAWVGATGGSAFGVRDWDWALLLATGPIGAAPLILFAFGARRLPLTLLGPLQYITPSLQLVIGIAFGELFTPAHAVTFGLIWTGLALYTWSGARARRAGADKAVR